MNKDVKGYDEFIEEMKLLDNRALIDKFHLLCRSIDQATSAESDQMSILKEMIYNRMK